ncbi:MAG: hypothetical protein N3D84_03940 [Candidatus Woesearchaeota archaeon]|nr:hypothetical protein [Candidatus Woesearchaeota archaeon]
MEGASDVSNKTVVVLLVLAILISIAGTFYSVSKLKAVSSGITGADILTQEGNVQATITSVTAINFTVNSVSFGTGTVAAICNNCTMHTPSVIDSTCCVGFTSPASGLVLENIGNKNASINLNFSNNAASFIGGTNPLFQLNVTEGEEGSCTNSSAPGSALAETWKNTFADVPTDNSEVCGNMHPDQGFDKLVFDIKVRIPDNSLTGLRNTTVTATATTI